MRALLTPLSFLLLIAAHAQTPDSKVTDAFLITRMVEKLHVQPRPLDKAMSAAIYGELMKALDDQRIFFTQADIAKLSGYQYRLDEEIRGRKGDFLQLLTGLYQQRLLESDTLVERLTAKPFVFTTKEVLTATEDSSYPADLAARRTKLYKLLKLSVGSRLAAAYLAAGEKGTSGSAAGKTRQQLLDSLEPRLRKRATVSIKRMIKRLMQSPTGIGNMIGIIYCQALATCYDPHTNYFSPDEKAEFETEIGNKPLSYGLTVAEDEEGHAQVGRLLPGGPAFQTGMLSEGDKIVAVRWEGKEAIDVSDATAAELYHILGTEGADRVTLGVRKADGTTREVSLQKQRISGTAEEEDDKVSGFLLKGAKTIGYISLPAFYEDWENNKGVNGCANDVAKEIIKLKKENIGGLILDLRYNGGGSMDEAIQLSGLFIDAGPVGQVVSRDAKVYTLKDINRGTVWSGPLLVLVNGSSASASEMVAGTLQDYNRALIVGSATYGKATAQVVFPMDTTIDLEHYNPQMKASSYLKLTISKLYRVNGSTAQMSGVKPDVVLPDPPGSETQREADERFVLPPAPIAANKYYLPLPALPVAEERAIAEKAMSGMAFFKEAAGSGAAASDDAGAGRDRKAVRDRSLNLDVLIAELKAAKGKTPDDKEDEEKNDLYTIGTPAYERPADEERKKDVLYDPYLQVAYQLIAGMIK